MDIETVVVEEVVGLEISRSTLTKYLVTEITNREEVLDKNTTEIVIRCIGRNEIGEVANITITIKNPEDVIYEVVKFVGVGEVDEE